MRKRIFSTAAAVVMAMIITCGTAVPAFAYADENADSGNENPVVVVEETEAETTDTTETEPEKEEPTGVITPNGNLSLADDLNTDEATGLQFMTVTTKDGHYFYIVIDRSSNAENVYFLNTVDETDLMALMSDEEKAQFTEKDEEKEQTQVVPVTDNTEKDQTDTGSDTADKPNDTANKNNQLTSSLTLLGIFGALGALIAAAYYFLKVKPNKGSRSIDEDREFYDDDEYENEDDIEQDVEDDEE